MADDKPEPNFPQVLYVTAMNDSFSGDDPDGEYYAADPTEEVAEDGDYVGVYQLVEVKRKRVTHTLEDIDR
jgi:hypothetical protein